MRGVGKSAVSCTRNPIYKRFEGDRTPKLEGGELGLKALGGGLGMFKSLRGA